MSQVIPSYTETTDELTLCPKCECPGGYILRIPRSIWRRLFHIKEKHYMCQECGHRFYTNAYTNY